MNRISVIALLIAASVSGAHAFQRQDQSARDHVAWVAEALKRMQVVTPGMTREILLTVFTTEGGISSREHHTYVSRDCPYFKVDVEFQPVDRPDGDDNGVNRLEGSRDVIVKISRPYLQFTIAD
jgi:hypothetical protein